MIVSAMAILLLASLVVMLHFVRKSVKEEAFQKAMQTLEGTVQRIDNILLSVEQTTGNAFFTMLPYVNQPEKVQQYAQRVVASNPYVVGCAVAMKPYFYKDRELFMAYYRHEDCLSAESPIVFMETFGNTPYTAQKWFKIPMASAKPGWIKPMKGEDGVGEPIMTFSLPIPGNDSLPIGIIGVDVSLSHLSQIVLSTKTSPNSYSMLLDGDGSFIVHPDSSKLLLQTDFTQLDQTAAATIKEASQAMASGETGYRPFRMKGTDYFVFYKPFKRTMIRGRAMEEVNWSVGIIYPEDDIFGDYNRLLYYVLAIALIGLLLLFVLSRIIIHRQLVPLRLLTASAQRIAQGNYHEAIPDSHQQDEIGRLQDHFQLMQQSLATNIDELEQMTETLRQREQELQAAYDHVRQADYMKTAFLHNMTNQMEGPAEVIVSDVHTLCKRGRHMAKLEAGRLADDIGQKGETIASLLDNLLHVSFDEKRKEERP